jgi:hypothetical protein
MFKACTGIGRYKINLEALNSYKICNAITNLIRNKLYCFISKLKNLLKMKNVKRKFLTI